MLGLLSYAAVLFTIVVSTIQVLLDNSRTAVFFFKGGPKGYLKDFLTFYSASHVAYHSFTTHESVYNPDMHLQFANAALAGQAEEITHTFTLQYPPLVYAYLMPLAHFSLQQAFVAFNAVSLITVILSGLLLREMTESTVLQTVLICVGALASFPFLVNFEAGQFGLMMLLALTAFWYFLQEKRYLAAAATISFAFVKLQFLPYACIAGLILGGRKFFAGLLAAYVAVGAICIALFGSDSIVAYPITLLSQESKGLVKEAHMDNIRGQLIAFTGNQHVSLIIAVICFLAALGVTAYLWQVWYKRNSEHPGAFEGCAAITTLLMPITALHSFSYDYTFYMIPVFMILMWLRLHRENLILRTTKKVFLTIFFLLPAASWVFLLAFVDDSAPIPRGMPLLGLCMAFTLFRSMQNTSTRTQQNL